MKDNRFMWWYIVVMKAMLSAFYKNPIVKAILALLIFALIILISKAITENNIVFQDNSQSSAVKGSDGHNDADYYYELGRINENVGDRTQAHENFGKALSLMSPHDPRIPAIYVYLARLEFQSDENPTEENKKEIQRYADLLIKDGNTAKEKAWGYALLLELYHMEDRQEEAIAAGKKALELQPNDPSLLHVLAEGYMEAHIGGKEFYYTNYLDETIDALETSLKSQRTQSHSLYLLGVAYWYKGETKKAYDLWLEAKRALSTDPYYPDWYKPILGKDIDEALEDPNILKAMEYRKQ
jgi:tetratricopeptide (TPR) repeat protein